MKCRKKCGVCCIVPDLTSKIPGMPKGKPAITPCIHLSEDYSCMIGYSDDTDPPFRSY